MPTVTLNGTSFAGKVSDADSVRRATYTITLSRPKYGKELRAADGTPTILIRGTKRSWELRWKRVPEVTRAAVETIAALSATFAFIHPNGTTYTVLCGLEDYQEEPDPDATLPTGPTYAYDVTLTVREA